LVIVLDGSPKAVRTIARQMAKGDHRIKIVELAHNQGVAHALNAGFDVLLGREDIRYLTWVSSDNIYYADYLELLRQALRHAPSKVGLSYSNFVFIDHAGHKTSFIWDERSFRRWQRQAKEELLDVDFIGASFMYKRRLAERIGQYRLDPIQDYDYWLRLTDHHDITYVDKALMAYRLNSTFSVSTELNTSIKQQRLARCNEQIARMEARQRRDIPCETTVLIPVTSCSDGLLKQLDTLFNQSYANYTVWLVSTVKTEKLSAFIQAMPDPRVSILPATSAKISTALSDHIEEIKTPFTFVLEDAAKHPADVYQLRQLVHTLKNAPTHIPGVQQLDAAVIYKSGIEKRHGRTVGLYRSEHLKSHMQVMGSSAL
jgi:hypothetical protein